jgi:hypothetical protein
MEDAMSEVTHKTLFSVIQTTDAEGHSFFQVEWHKDLYPTLEEMTPEGVLTDRLIDLAEELVGADEPASD